jgi:hypothetical protein
LVKWDDGSFQLVIGNAVYDSKLVESQNCYVFEQQKGLSLPATQAASSSSSSSSSSASSSQETLGDEGGEVGGSEGSSSPRGTTAAAKEISCWECVGDTNGRMLLQPASLNSETHARRSLIISQKFKKESHMGIEDYTQHSQRPEKRLNEIARQHGENWVMSNE